MARTAKGTGTRAKRNVGTAGTRSLKSTAKGVIQVERDFTINGVKFGIDAENHLPMVANSVAKPEDLRYLANWSVFSLGLASSLGF